MQVFLAHLGFGGAELRLFISDNAQGIWRLFIYHIHCRALYTNISTPKKGGFSRSERYTGFHVISPFANKSGHYRLYEVIP